jgi:hypothetical protein
MMIQVGDNQYQPNLENQKPLHHFRDEGVLRGTTLLAKLFARPLKIGITVDVRH